MTTYEKLLEMGYTDEQIREAEEELDPRMFSVSVVDTSDGYPIVGIRYMCDYRSEEEEGVGKMMKIFDGAQRQADYVHLAGDGFVIFGADYVDPYLIARARAHWSGSMPYAQRFDSLQTYRMTVPEMKAWAKEHDLKLTGLKKRDEIELKLLDHHTETVKGDSPNRYPGYFHNGVPLILKASGSGVVRDVLALMVSAALDNNLGVSSGSGAFSSGFGFYNKKDIGPKLQAEIDEATNFHNLHMNRLAPVLEELKEKGYGFYFLGRPTQTPEGVKYWLNGMIKGNVAKQPFGWYTLEELKAEKFAEDTLNKD